MSVPARYHQPLILLAQALATMPPRTLDQILLALADPACLQALRQLVDRIGAYKLRHNLLTGEEFAAYLEILQAKEKS